MVNKEFLEAAPLDMWIGKHLKELRLAENEEERLRIGYAKEQLDHNVGHKFWKGKDIAIAKKAIIPPTTHENWFCVKGIMEPDCLPNLERPHQDIVPNPNLEFSDVLNKWRKICPLPKNKGIDPIILKYVYPSTRSRWAQAGIDIHDAQAGEIARHIQDNPQCQSENGKILEPIEVPLLLTNRSQSPIFLPEGARIFRFYYEYSAPLIYGENLENFIRSGKIKVEGNEGEDWFLSRYKDGQIAGISVKIDPKSWHYIPKDKLPITVNDSTKEYRKELDSLLRSIPKTSEKILCIGETPKTTFIGVEGLLSRSVTPDFKGEIEDINTLNKWGMQTNSYLIDNGTDNTVRVEVITSTLGEMPQFVHYRFRQAAS